MNDKKVNIKNIFSLAYENHTKKNFKLAESLYKKVLQIDDNHLETNFLLGTLHLQIKNFDQSIFRLQKATQINPKHEDSYHNLGSVYLELGELNKAIYFYNKVIEINPNHIEAYYNLGNSYKILRNFKKAEDFYKKTIKLHPKNTKAYNNLGNVLKELGKLKEAINSYNMAIKIQSNHAHAYHNLGNVFKEMGDFQKAKISYKKAFQFQPTNLETLDTLSSLDKQILDEKLLTQIKTTLKSKNLMKKDVAYGNFLLAKYELSKNNFEGEFEYLLKGHNEYFNSKKAYFERGKNHWLNEIPKNTELTKFSRKKNYDQNKLSEYKPIFILGVPRCGSTLVEKVIASNNDQILIGEETGIFSFVVGENIIEKKSISENIENIKKKIINMYRERNLIKNNKNQIFTDKSLDNFFFIRIIKEVFPNAKFINCKRNVNASIISILKNNLGDVSWAHNLDDIFKYFDIYFKKINDYKKIYPEFIYDLELEIFVKDPVVQSKKLMEFCNITWNKKCLEFYKRKDITSKTASNVQIRKAIYEDDINKYSVYKKLLLEFTKKYSWYNK